MTWQQGGKLNIKFHDMVMTEKHFPGFQKAWGRRSARREQAC